MDAGYHNNSNLDTTVGYNNDTLYMETVWIGEGYLVDTLIFLKVFLSYPLYIHTPHSVYISKLIKKNLLYPQDIASTHTIPKKKSGNGGTR